MEMSFSAFFHILIRKSLESRNNWITEIFDADKKGIGLNIFYPN